MTTPVGLVDGTFAGTDLHAVYELQRNEIGAPHIPALVELPDVGPHATDVGKVAANLSVPLELRSYGWQLQHGTRISASDQLRATSHRDSVIQAMADIAAADAIPEVSVRLVGPVTLMMSGWLPSGQRILRDPGAREDLAGAWVEGAATLSARMRAVLGATPTLLIDELQAHRAVTGQVRTASGAGFERSIDLSEVRTYWEAAHTPDANVLLETSAELVDTAAEVGGIILDWPQGRSLTTERTWERVDGLVQAQKPVAFQIQHRDNPQRYAEELIEQYLDWGVSPSGLDRVHFVRRFDRAGEVETGAGLQWLRMLADHAAGYVTTL
ncbi:hypothetical protein [Yaniella halotolerans]|uniref:hypothetical protein n=1 Tax=Yaniella halotolerans TaxID=225453 RepID=UPI0003B4E827|nr:hypothetical protein [Yaniella halotolerans]